MKKEKLLFSRTGRVQLEKIPLPVLTAKDILHISFFCSL